MAETATESKEAMEHRVGVLFVHGIGEQPQGDTLLRFATPLIKWLRDWLAQPATQDPLAQQRGQLRIDQAVLAPPLLEQADPAHVLISLESPDTPQNKWLLAESWWASEFRKPPFAQLAGWMLTTGTWVILSHAGKRIRLAGSRLSKVRAAAGFLFSIPLATLLQALVAVLALLAILPIPPLRRWLSGALLKLTGTLGDCYVLLTSPIERAAAVNHVRSDLQWLARQCRQVVVVAHSQGAAIAHEALQIAEPGNVSLLLTLGSGIGKLEELQLLQQQGQAAAPVRMLWAAPLALPLFIISVLVTLLALPEAVAQGYMDPVAEWTASLSLAVFLLVIRAALGGWGPYLQRLPKLSLCPIRPGLEWMDCYSGADPVTNGPLSEEVTPVERISLEQVVIWCLASKMSTSAQIPGMSSIEVVNQRSMFKDHSAYWDNRDQFVSLVALQTSAQAGGGLLHIPGDIERFAKVSRDREFRVGSLVFTRWCTFVGAALALFGVRYQLATWGEWILKVLASAPVLQPVVVLLKNFASLGGILAALFAATDSGTPGDADSIFLGAVLPILFFWVWHTTVTTNLWNWWDRLHTSHLLNPIQPEPLFRPIFVWLSGLTPLLAGITLLFWSQPLDAVKYLAHISHMGLTWLLLILFVTVYLQKLRGWWKRRRVTKAGTSGSAAVENRQVMQPNVEKGSIRVK